MAGTSIGYFLNDLMPPEILRLVIFITPIYILLLLMNAQQTVNRMAAALGGAACPFLYLAAGDWAILLSGIIGGSVALALFYLRKKLIDSEAKMAEYTLFETWLTIFLAALATFSWRFSGLILVRFYSA